MMKTIKAYAVQTTKFITRWVNITWLVIEAITQQ